MMRELLIYMIEITPMYGKRKWQKTLENVLLITLISPNILTPPLSSVPPIQHNQQSELPHILKTPNSQNITPISTSIRSKAKPIHTSSSPFPLTNSPRLLPPCAHHTTPHNQPTTLHPQNPTPHSISPESTTPTALKLLYQPPNLPKSRCNTETNNITYNEQNEVYSK